MQCEKMPEKKQKRPLTIDLYEEQVRVFLVWNKKHLLTEEAMQDLPRVLVLNSQTMYKNNATGITLRSIFRLLPAEKVMEIYRYNPKDSVPDRFAFQSIQIPPQTMPMNFLFRKLLGYDNYYESQSNTGKSYGSDVFFSWRSVIKAYIKALLEKSMIIADRNFMQAVDQFEPQVIYTLGASFYTHTWVLFLSKRYDCPIIMHYMDDWRHTAYKQDKRLKRLHTALERQVAKVEKRMYCGFTISEYMAEAYKAKYNHHYYPIMNTVDIFPTQRQRHDYLNIVYAGGLHLNRYDTLLEVERVIGLFPQMRLIVYTSTSNREKYERFFDSSITEFREAVAHDRIAEVYDNADILLHIESFDPEIIRFTRYSLSTKIPEYMAAGKPIVCFAPSEIAVFKYIVSSGSGIGVLNCDEMKEALIELQSEDSRRIYAQNGLRTAKKNHSTEKMLEILEEVLKNYAR